MATNRFRHSLWLVTLVACATTPMSAPDAEATVTAAEADVVAGRHDEAIDGLGPLAEEACPKRLRDRRDLVLARAHVGSGEAWEGFRVLETFADTYPHSDLRPVVVELVWEIGQSLASSDRGFLFFWSDSRAGRTVLEHLITRYPESQRLADALRILGDMSFAEGDYELAQQRFRDLMLNRPESEWRVYAQFRFAMSIVASLEGPDYDLDRMQLATRELRDFLGTKPENPDFVRAATESLARLTQWQIQRHQSIAAFYHRVGNVAGRRYHLELATQSEFAGAEGYAEAAALREQVERELAAKARGTP